MAAAQPIVDPDQVERLALYYLEIGELRNYVLIMIGLYSALRVSDVLALDWDDVYDFKRNKVKSSIHLREQKTGKPKSFAVNPDIAKALSLFAATGAARRGAPLIENTRTGKAISRNHAYRITRAAGEALDFEFRISCHSLRKTFGYHTWRVGVDPVLLVSIFNHSSLAVTMRYLCITQEEKDKVYMDISFLNTKPDIYAVTNIDPGRRRLSDRKVMNFL